MVRRVVLLLLFVAVVAPVHTQTARQDRFFDSQGVKIRYIDVGQGEPVVLIHGFSSDLDQSWGNPGTIDRLAADFRVVALDVRGHGKSDKPHDTASYGLPVVEDVTRLLDHLHIAKAHIVGYSMGGAITGKFIALHPDRTISAVFGGSAPRTGWTAQTEKDSEELATSLETGHGIRPLILRLSPPGEPPPSEETIAARSRATLGQNDALALAAVQRGNKAQVITLADVNGLKMPLLAIIGSADPIKAGVDAFKRVKPELEVVVLEGATHSGERGAPARPEFRDALHAFLAMHRATTSQAR
jgi:pimeloyl-ACP methyl ester carboxylesterase